MVWIDSSPVAQVPVSIPSNDTIIKIIHATHTPLLVVLTQTYVLIYDQYTLLPLSYHKRSDESIETQGFNEDIKVKQLSVDTSQLEKILTINLFIQTNSNYLIIYQVLINYNKSLFEVFSKTNDELIQTSVPLCDTSSKTSITSIIKSATRAIIQGADSSKVNLENVEHFNNNSIEDGYGASPVEFVKLSIFKILKISIGVNKFWLKSNSNNLIIFNKTNEIQLINLSTFKNQVLDLLNYEWFDDKWTIVSLNYNIFQNYFLIVNDINEIWYVFITVNESSEITLSSEKVYTINNENAKVGIVRFNSQHPLVLLEIDSQVHLFKLGTNIHGILQLSLVKIFSNINAPHKSFFWSPCGDFFMVIDHDTGYWKGYSKFGNILFSSNHLTHDIVNTTEQSLIDFLKVSQILIAPNSQQLYLLSHNQSRIYIVNLLKLNGYNSPSFVFNDMEYLIVPSVNNTINKFPITPNFKSIIQKHEVFNGSISNGKAQSLNGKIKISCNQSSQISMSFGSHLSISTPIHDGNNTNHILWYNFHNYYMETLNLIDHFWYDDYLIMINRFVKDDELLVDELIVLDTSTSKFGMSGFNNFKFDSDLIVWRHNFNNKILSYDLSSTGDENTKNLVIVSSNLKIIIVELSKNTKKPQSNKIYRIFIGISKTIHLSSIKNKLAVELAHQICMIDQKHFLFLLSNGDFYLLKNQTVDQSAGASGGGSNPVDILKSKSNMYDLIKINESIEYFQVTSLAKFTTIISLFNGSSLLVYNLQEMVDSAFDNTIHSQYDDGISSFEEAELTSKQNVTEPIEVEISKYYYPLTISDSENKYHKNIELVGFEMLTSFQSNNVYLKQKLFHQLILDQFIEYDLFKLKLTDELVIEKYQSFKNFDYCLELILFKYLAQDSFSDQNSSHLTRIIKLVDSINKTSVFINCLRKIEVAYWSRFFNILNLTPVEYMNKLITLKDEELCYNFLIVYLNFKKEYDVDKTEIVYARSPSPSPSAISNTLDNDDYEIILKIIKILDKSEKWELCFELCRFIKLLEPTNNLLQLIKKLLQQGK